MNEFAFWKQTAIEQQARAVDEMCRRLELEKEVRELKAELIEATGTRTCYACRGTGADDLVKSADCSRCYGEGTI